MNHDDRIIIHPERQPHGARTLFGAITALFWALYAYLWLPLITVLAWLVGIRTATLRLYLQREDVSASLLTEEEARTVFERAWSRLDDVAGATGNTENTDSA